MIPSTDSAPRETAGTDPYPAGEVKTLAEAFFDGPRGSHDWEHTLRVCGLCRRIGPMEGAEMPVLLSAAYLHDIGRGHQDRSRGAVCHAEKGVALSRGLLKSLLLTRSQIDAILHCIAAHRYRGGEEPRSTEARVLFDADKLDAIGAVGIARTYLFAGEQGAMLHNPDHRIDGTKPYTRDDTGYREYRLKLSKIRGRMLTDAGRRMAEDRHRFMVAFFDRFLDELSAIR